MLKVTGRAQIRPATDYVRKQEPNELAENAVLHRKASRHCRENPRPALYDLYLFSF